MARRASSSTSPAWFVVTLILTIGFAIGGYWIYSYLNNPLRTIPPLPVQAYLDNSSSLRGNRYQVEGVVANQLGWSAERGRLYSMEINDASEVIAVFIPAEFNATNIQKGQRLVFEVEVAEKGILSAKSFHKA